MISALRRRTAPVPVPKAVDRFLQVSLLGMLASGYLAVAMSESLDAPTLLVTGAAILLRALMVAGLLRFSVPDHVATVLAIAYFGFYPIDFYFISREFLPATVHLVFFLAAVLVVKASTRRDYLFLKLIALMEILSASLLSTGVSFLLCLPVFVLCGIAAQASGEIDANLKAQRAVAREGMRGAHRRLAGLVCFLFVGVLAVSAALFFVLPRTARAALRHLVPDRYHLPGFSNEVTLGEIGEVQMRSTPVMHVRMQNTTRPLALKWRGSALSMFDGKRWFNDSERGEKILAESGLVRLVDYAQQLRKGERIAYEVQLKSLTGDVLFLAGTPEFVWVESKQLIRTPVGGYRLGAGFGSGILYGAHSYLESAEPQPNPAMEQLTPRDRAAYLQTPFHLDPRVRDLARRVTRDSATDLERAKTIERHLSTSYAYTTELLRRPVPDALSHFLFTRRKGHCEYFASAMAVMLRTVGIPSRVATGFQSGEYNPISGWYVIRASDAHSWVEAWLPRYGWITLDPTPPDPSRRAASLLGQMRFYLDALDVFWQSWVMSYDREQQLLLASKMGHSGRSFSSDWMRRLQTWKVSWRNAAGAFDLRVALALALTLVWVALAVWFGPRLWDWWRTHLRVRKLQRAHGMAGDATVLYQRMLRVLHRRGLEKPAWLTPAEFAQLVPGVESRRIVEELTREYHALRFGGIGEAAPRMVSLLEQLEQTYR